MKRALYMLIKLFVMSIFFVSILFVSIYYYFGHDNSNKYIEQKVLASLPHWCTVSGASVSWDNFNLKTELADVFIQKEVNRYSITANLGRVEIYISLWGLFVGDDKRIKDVIINNASFQLKELDVEKSQIDAQFSTSYINLIQYFQSKLLETVDDKIRVSNSHVFFSDKIRSFSVSGLDLTLQHVSNTWFSNDKVMKVDLNMENIEIAKLFNKLSLNFTAQINGHIMQKSTNKIVSKMAVNAELLNSIKSVSVDNGLNFKLYSTLDNEKDEIKLYVPRIKVMDGFVSDLKITNAGKVGLLINANESFLTSSVLDFFSKYQIGFWRNVIMKDVFLYWKDISKTEDVMVNFLFNKLSFDSKLVSISSLEGEVKGMLHNGTIDITLDTDNITNLLIRNNEKGIVNIHGNWYKSGTDVNFHFDPFDFQYAGISARIEGSLKKIMHGPIIELSANFSHPSLKDLNSNLLKDALPSDLFSWLQMSLDVPNAVEGSLTLNNLSEQPELNINAYINNFDFKFDKDWPMLFNTNAALNYSNQLLKIDLTGGDLLESELEFASTEIDIHNSSKTHIHIDMQLIAELSKMLKNLKQGPLSDDLIDIPYLFKNALIKLSLDVPVEDEWNMGVYGKIFMPDNVIKFNNNFISLYDFSGTAEFEKNIILEREAKTNSTFKINLEGNSKIKLTLGSVGDFTANSVLDFTGNKKGDSSLLYDSTVNIFDISSSTVQMDNLLKGERNLVFKINKYSPELFKLGLLKNKQISAALELEKDIKSFWIMKGYCNLGHVNDDDMLCLKQVASGSNIDLSGLQFELDSLINELSIFKHVNNNVIIQYVKKADNHMLLLNSDDLIGGIAVNDKEYKLSFERLKIDSLNLWDENLIFADSNVADSNVADSNVEIDVTNLFIHNIPIGALSLNIDSMNSLATKKIVGSLDGKNITNLIEFLGFHNSNVILNAVKAKFNFVLTNTNKFSFENLNGTIIINSDKGYFRVDNKSNYSKSFLQKFWSLISIDKLPNRLRLDFRDLSRDYHFNKIDGHISIQDGFIKTNNLLVLAPSWNAEVDLIYDIAQKIVDAKMFVLPHVLSGLPAVAALALGPVLGIASLVANELVGQNVNRASGVRFWITGKIDDLEITKVQ